MHLWIQDMIIKDNVIWFTARNMAGVLKYNIDEGKCEIESIFPDKYLDEILMSGSIDLIDDTLIIAPIKGNSIYLLESKKFTPLRS